MPSTIITVHPAGTTGVQHPLGYQQTEELSMVARTPEPGQAIQHMRFLPCISRTRDRIRLRERIDLLLLLLSTLTLRHLYAASSQQIALIFGIGLRYTHPRDVFFGKFTKLKFLESICLF